MSDNYSQLSKNAVLYSGKSINVAANTGVKVKIGFSDSTKFISDKYDEVIIKPKFIALLNKTDTEKLLNAIDLISLPATISPQTLAALALIRNLVFVLDKYKKGLESKEETQTELNSFFNQIEMKDVFVLALPFISKLHPQSGKILTGIIPLLVNKK